MLLRCPVVALSQGSGEGKVKEPRFRYPMWLKVRKNGSGMSESELRRERQAFRDGWEARGRAERKQKAQGRGK